MNKTNLLYFLFIICLAACSGSDAYRGEWQAIDVEGHHYQLHFGENSFSIEDSVGQKENYEYTQNRIQIENSTSRYGINIETGRSYTIVFLNGNKKTGAIYEDEELIFSINR